MRWFKSNFSHQKFRDSQTGVSEDNISEVIHHVIFEQIIIADIIPEVGIFSFL